MNPSRTTRLERVAALRAVLADSSACHMMPSCYDGITAHLIERAGFKVAFMSGYCVAASHGLPDCGLLGMEEVARTASVINTSLRRIPIIADIDTGFGNSVNIKRTLDKMRQAGCAGIMIEDQVMPKRCGHTKGKMVVSREESFRRIRAAVDARNEGEDLVILARTDARGAIGMDEALFRCRRYIELGADWSFLEAPLTKAEMRRYCQEVPGPKMANMIEFGKTPVLNPSELHKMGFRVAMYSVSVLSAGLKAMQEELVRIKNQDSAGCTTEDKTHLLDFKELNDIVGFNRYYEEYSRYEATKPTDALTQTRNSG